MQVSFAGSKSIATFEVPNCFISVRSFDFTGNRFDKAGFFSDIFSSQRDDSLATFPKSLASFVIYILQTFNSTMPNCVKSSKAAQGARATKSYSTLKSEERQSPRLLIRSAVEQAFDDCDRILTERDRKARIYRVEIHALGTWSDDYKGGVFHADNYTAPNQECAIGMAIRHITTRFPNHAVMLSDLKCSLLNPAAL